MWPHRLQYSRLPCPSLSLEVYPDPVQILPFVLIMSFTVEGCHSPCPCCVSLFSLNVGTVPPSGLDFHDLVSFINRDSLLYKISFNQKCLMFVHLWQKHYGKEAVITIVFSQMAHDLICLRTDNIHLIELVFTGPLHQKITPFFCLIHHVYFVGILTLWKFSIAHQNFNVFTW